VSDPARGTAGNPMTPGPGQVGSDYYDSSDYFEGRGSHLTDPTSSFHRYRVARVLELARPSQGDRVVDLGCGWGTLSFALAQRVREVVGVDFSARAVELCRARQAREGVGDHLRFLRADAADTGLPGASWDLVVAADLVEHLYPEQTDAVYREAFRLLRPGGRLAIWTPHRGHILEILKNHDILLRRDESHVDYKSMERIVAGLRRAGFDVERAAYVASHVPVLRYLERALQGLVPPLRRRIAVAALRPDASVAAPPEAGAPGTT
jgi:cyclopropane fatty-acyl-phospholipid synthase-like methyltransferase